MIRALQKTEMHELKSCSEQRKVLGFSSFSLGTTALLSDEEIKKDLPGRTFIEFQVCV